jgi:hypothetical protein
MALAGCTAGLALAAPAAIADDDSDQGIVLEETVATAQSAVGEQTCRTPDLFNPLVAFKDKRDYFMAPSGDFEDPALPGWQLSGGAAVSDGSSPHGATGANHENALTLPPGSSAVSPEFCVDLNYPTFRFFATQLSADADADLLVDVVYPALQKDNVRQARKLKYKAKDGWRLSDDVKLEPQRLGKRSGWRRVAIRFRVEEGKKPATYRVDDLLIDPRRVNCSQPATVTGVKASGRDGRDHWSF